MTPWWLILLGGLLGSSHCVGMCGPFAAIVGLRQATLWANLRAQLLYSAGRISSYALLGGIAGYAGKRLMASVPQMVNVPAILCLVAGVFLLREGLLATGLWKNRVTGTSATGCLLGPLFSTILKAPGARNTFVAGIVTGFLPCGLVYAFVSLAGSSGDLLTGFTTMLAFGAGTVPLMIVTGCGASLLSWSARQRLWKVAAWSVVLTGALTVGRGVAFVQWSEETPPAGCPFCAKRKPSSSLAAPVVNSSPSAQADSPTL